MSKKNKGWRNEPKRHSLARKGIKTGRKVTNIHKKLFDISKKQSPSDEAKLLRLGITKNIRMNTLLSNDKRIRKLERVSSIHRDDDWYDEWNKTARQVLIEAGFNTEEINEHLINRSKTIQDFGSRLLKKFHVKEELDKIKLPKLINNSDISRSYKYFVEQVKENIPLTPKKLEEITEETKKKFNITEEKLAEPFEKSEGADAFYLFLAGEIKERTEILGELTLNHFKELVDTNKQLWWD